MDIEVDKRGGPVGSHYYADADGYAMPPAPDSGPRRIPLGDFPTGPEVGTRFPNVVATDQHGRQVDVHEDRSGHPAVVVFYRSAVW